MERMQNRLSNGLEGNGMSRRKIVLPDDIDLFLELKRTFLSVDDLDMLATGSGAEAYAMTQYYQPDMVFLDLRMKEMDGDECCWQIKHNPELRSIPVTMLVENQRDESLKRCLEAGCDHVLSRPLDPDQLAATVRKFEGGIVRTAPRVEARLRVRFGHDQDLLTSYSVNLSTGGLFLETEDPLPAETPLNLEFDLPTGASIIACQGRVAWVNPPDRSKKQQLPPGMGIQFLNLSLEDMGKIRDFVKRECISASW